MAQHQHIPLPWWWIAILSVSTVIAVLISLIVPAVMVINQKRAENEKGKKKNKKAKKNLEDYDEGGGYADEPWHPKLTVRGWERAKDIEDCPWDFDQCESLEDALKVIWRAPVHKLLNAPFAEIKKTLKTVRVAKVSLAWPPEEHFAVIYTLENGSELFAGAPQDLAVGLDLNDGDDDGLFAPEAQPPAFNPPGIAEQKGLRPDNRMAKAAAEAKLPLPDLAPFFRIHDGFGVLLSVRHLSTLLLEPSNAVYGSCFYVYPIRSLEQVDKRPNLLKFGRVDRNCVACADPKQEFPNIVYHERSGEDMEDESPPIQFVADTIMNIAQQQQKIAPKGPLGSGSNPATGGGEAGTVVPT